MNQPSLRKDLEWIRYEDQNRWVVRDPISNAFYYFSGLEYYVCQQLNGKNTLEDILKKLRILSLASTLDAEWLQFLLGRLSAARLLLIPGVPTEGRGSGSKKNLSAFANLLSIRVPLFRWVRYPRMFFVLSKIFFHPMSFAFLIAGLVVSVGLVLNKTLRSSSSLFDDLAAQPTVWWLQVFICYLLVKSLHEFSHLLACIRWRVACSEIGILFLVLTPCFYCDTTESWRLPSKWKRAAIAFAGIYAELWVAVFAGIIYALTLPGLLNSLANATFVAATLGTLLVNANPFFRFDGYYILSDVWGVPNLSSQSRKALWRTCMWCLGSVPPRPQEYDSDYRLLCLFSLFAMVYRWFILSAIVLFLWHFFGRMELAVLGSVFLASIALSLVMATNRGVTVFMSEFFTKQPIHSVRVLALGSLMLLGIFLFFTYPIPNGRYARGYAEYEDKKAIFWPIDGQLVSLSESSTELQKGDVIAVGRNADRALEVLELESSIQQLVLRLRNLEQISTIDESVVNEILPLRELLNERIGRHERLAAELRSLTITAPSTGQLLLTGVTHGNSLSEESESLQSSPILASQKILSFVDRGVQIAEFSESRRIRFVAVVPETVAKRIPPNATAIAVIDSIPNHPIHLRLERIDIDAIEEVPVQIQSDPSFVFQRSESGTLKLASPHYLFYFKTEDVECLDSSLASILIHLPPQTLAKQIWLRLLEAFLLDRR